MININGKNIEKKKKTNIFSNQFTVKRTVKNRSEPKIRKKIRRRNIEILNFFRFWFDGTKLELKVSFTLKSIESKGLFL